MYKGKPINLNLEERNYSIRDISDISNHSRNHVTYILKQSKVVAVGKIYCDVARQSVNVFNHKDINKAFNQEKKAVLLYSVPKKERKPYFEFAYQSFESKINNCKSKNNL